MESLSIILREKCNLRIFFFGAFLMLNKLWNSGIISLCWVKAFGSFQINQNNGHCTTSTARLDIFKYASVHFYQTKKLICILFGLWTSETWTNSLVHKNINRFVPNRSWYFHNCHRSILRGVIYLLIVRLVAYWMSEGSSHAQCQSNKRTGIELVNDCS